MPFLRAVKSPRGTLMIVKNYDEDVHNFSKALEQAMSEGMDVKMVIVGEDCVLPSTGEADKRRGLCGTILIHKVGKLCECALYIKEHDEHHAILTANLPAVSLILRLSLSTLFSVGGAGNEGKQPASTLLLKIFISRATDQDYMKYHEV